MFLNIIKGLEKNDDKENIININTQKLLGDKTYEKRKKGAQEIAEDIKLLLLKEEAEEQEQINILLNKNNNEENNINECKKISESEINIISKLNGKNDIDINNEYYFTSYNDNLKTNDEGNKENDTGKNKDQIKSTNKHNVKWDDKDPNSFGIINEGTEQTDKDEDNREKSQIVNRDETSTYVENEDEQSKAIQDKKENAHKDLNEEKYILGAEIIKKLLLDKCKENCDIDIKIAKPNGINDYIRNSIKGNNKEEDENDIQNDSNEKNKKNKKSLNTILYEHEIYFDHLNKKYQNKKIMEILYFLDEKFIKSINSSERCGGLISLAFISISLENKIKYYFSEILKIIMSCINDSDPKVRYYVCESLYNLCKVSKNIAFNNIEEIFNCLYRIFSDTCPNVKTGGAFLDNLLKDMTCSYNNIFNIYKIVYTLKDNIYIENTNARQLIISWLFFLQNIPTIDVFEYFHFFIRDLFLMLSDENKDIQKQANQCLDLYMDKIVTSNYEQCKMFFKHIIPIFLEFSRHKNPTIKHKCLLWIYHFINILNIHFYNIFKSPKKNSFFMIEILKKIIWSTSDVSFDIHYTARKCNELLIKFLKFSTLEYSLLITELVCSIIKTKIENTHSQFQNQKSLLLQYNDQMDKQKSNNSNQSDVKYIPDKKQSAYINILENKNEQFFNNITVSERKNVQNTSKLTYTLSDNTFINKQLSIDKGSTKYDLNTNENDDFQSVNKYKLQNDDSLSRTKSEDINEKESNATHINNTNFKDGINASGTVNDTNLSENQNKIQTNNFEKNNNERNRQTNSKRRDRSQSICSSVMNDSIDGSKFYCINGQDKWEDEEEKVENNNTELLEDEIKNSFINKKNDTTNNLETNQNKQSNVNDEKGHNYNLGFMYKHERLLNELKEKKIVLKDGKKMESYYINKIIKKKKKDNNDEHSMNASDSSNSYDDNLFYDNLEKRNIYPIIMCLQWLTEMLVYKSNEIKSYYNKIIDCVFLCLKNEDNKVLVLTLTVISAMCSTVENKFSFYENISRNFIDLFKQDESLLIRKGKEIIQHMSRCLNNKKFFAYLCYLLIYETDYIFVNKIVQVLNWVLLTSNETKYLRNSLLFQKDNYPLFSIILIAWFSNSLCAISFLLWLQKYELAYFICSYLTLLDINSDFFHQLDNFIFLFESPVFSKQRLHLIYPKNYPFLIKSLMILSLMLPLNTSNNILQKRLQISQLSMLTNNEQVSTFFDTHNHNTNYNTGNKIENQLPPDSTKDINKNNEQSSQNENVKPQYNNQNSVELNELFSLENDEIIKEHSIIEKTQAEKMSEEQQWNTKYANLLNNIKNHLLNQDHSNNNTFDENKEGNEFINIFKAILKKHSLIKYYK
ncbi:VAC14 domain-containing protein, putative [Plasmodium vinckei vinckei]|uniref:VAC14 domain-containing protein, putative n=1 Tax=Plasmodium vinckei vinckei TaxID=54757 RepID=A0A449C0J6_PLAVN|nr:VAC14 domain-containing protein, putative [Plasmodium vinckei vinckei]VEV59182.1 VAC14 domain-containing protein, putative [Plasmodium vinckei vinckei]